MKSKKVFYADQPTTATVQVKKVTSSHSKNLTEILSEAPLDEELLKKTVADTGYTLKGIAVEEVEKKKFSLFG